jgi:hypothetical protein
MSDDAAIDRLFSYGTLQLPAVQMATFGRLLSGSRDLLRGFDLVPLKIEDEAKLDAEIARLKGLAGLPFRRTSAMHGKRLEAALAHSGKRVAGRSDSATGPTRQNPHPHVWSTRWRDFSPIRNSGTARASS